MPIRIMLIASILIGGCGLNNSTEPNGAVETDQSPSDTNNEGPTDPGSGSDGGGPVNDPIISPPDPRMPLCDSAPELCEMPGSGYLAVFETHGEQWHQRLMTEQTIRDARSVWLDGAVLGPVGNLVCTSSSYSCDCNREKLYGFHLDPESIYFTKYSVEVCDGRPDQAERSCRDGRRWCPWNTLLTNLFDCTSGECKAVPKDSERSADFEFTDASKKTFRIRVLGEDRITHACRLLAGSETRQVHVGATLRCEAESYNPAYPFHLDPADLYFFENEIEECDATIGGRMDPSDPVAYWDGRCDKKWCPWSSELTRAADSATCTGSFK